MILLTTLLTFYAIQLIATRFIHRRIIKLLGKYKENDAPYWIPMFGLVVMLVFWSYVAEEIRGKNPKKISRLRKWFENKDLEDGK